MKINIYFCCCYSYDNYKQLQYIYYYFFFNALKKVYGLIFCKNSKTILKQYYIKTFIFKLSTVYFINCFKSMLVKHCIIIILIHLIIKGYNLKSIVTIENHLFYTPIL